MLRWLHSPSKGFMDGPNPIIVDIEKLCRLRTPRKGLRAWPTIPLMFELYPGIGIVGLSITISGNLPGPGRVWAVSKAT